MISQPGCTLLPEKFSRSRHPSPSRPYQKAPCSSSAMAMTPVLACMWQANPSFCGQHLEMWLRNSLSTELERRKQPMGTANRSRSRSATSSWQVFVGFCDRRGNAAPVAYAAARPAGPVAGVPWLARTSPAARLGGQTCTGVNRGRPRPRSFLQRVAATPAASGASGVAESGPAPAMSG
jgi:hypothetical protein